jgi:hypothetical protein
VRPAEPPRRADQLAEDLTIAAGPVLLVFAVLRAIQDAHIIHGGPWGLWTYIWWVAVPQAAFLLHRDDAPELRPTAVAGRRVLTWVAIAVTAALAVTCAVVDGVLVTCNALDGWSLLEPLIAIVPLLAASRAIRRHQGARRSSEAVFFSRQR